jgi:hypothetical protein
VAVLLRDHRANVLRVTFGALYGEMFPTRVRLSAMAIGTQIGFAIGGFAPTAAAAIAGGGSGGWVPVGAYVLAFSVLAAIAIATARETAHVPMSELDQRQEVGRPAPARTAAATDPRERDVVVEAHPLAQWGEIGDGAHRSWNSLRA